jgi:ATP-binding cassette subfamily B protein
MVRSLAEGIEGILVTKVFGREREQYRRFQEKNQAVREQQGVIFRNVSRFSPGIDFLNQFAIVVLLAYGAFLVGQHEVSLGDLIVFAGLLQQFASRASSMASIVNTLQQSLAGARRVFEILDTALDVADPAEPVPPFRIRGQVRFDDVSFRYRDGTSAIKQLSLEIAPGECLGILGATGAGKSTVLSLLSRFYDPTSGIVSIDGVDLREMRLSDLRRQIGVVFQETFLFRDTIFNNIAFGTPDATLEQVEMAAKLAGAAEFIQKLELGYQSPLEEGAVNLSGGQRQRLAIARALLGEPAILLLDDPTAAVDATTEGKVLNAIFHAAKGRTTLLVSNRVSTLARADRILVLEDGALSQLGTSSELSAMPGLYRTLLELSQT